MKTYDDTYSTYMTILRKHASKNGEVKVKKDKNSDTKTEPAKDDKK